MKIDCYYGLNMDNPTIDCNGNVLWSKDGQLHNTTIPAVILPNGTELWYLNGKVHRTGGPAVIHPGGTKMWYSDGNIHRENGPAVIRHDGEHGWYINGWNYDFNDYCEKLNISNEDRLLLRIKYG